MNPTIEKMILQRMRRKFDIDDWYHGHLTKDGRGFFTYLDAWIVVAADNSAATRHWYRTNINATGGCVTLSEDLPAV